MSVDGSRQDGERGPKGSARWWEEGEEPDYRATMANERTFLAWSRTALALLAGALAVLGLGQVGPYGVRLGLACYLIVLAVAATVSGYWQWRVRQRRMRLRQPLGHSTVNATVGLAFLVLAGLVVAAVATGPR
ncbi:YidH family protein [Kitasatospora sp. NPDC094019]|uniref:YidH family protein n=1 Tax=Kitasatospora sp. NPDC094019 TaxID=3364091 RepID=UPI003828612F